MRSTWTYVDPCIQLLIIILHGGMSAICSFQLAKSKSVIPVAATLMLFCTTAIAAKRDLTSNDDIVPKQVFVNEEAHIPCADIYAKHVEWLYQRNQFEERTYIASKGNLTNGDRGSRLRIDRGRMIINNVKISDQGIYICRSTSSGQIKEHRILLTVYDQQTVSEKTLTALIGKKVTLPCTTSLKIPVDWYYLPSQHERGKVICVAGNIRNGFTERFALDRSAFGDYSLVIRSVTRSDQGIYICREGAGVAVEHRLTLNVHEKEKRTSTNWRPQTGTTRIITAGIFPIEEEKRTSTNGIRIEVIISLCIVLTVIVIACVMCPRTYGHCCNTRDCCNTTTRGTNAYGMAVLITQPSTQVGVAGQSPTRNGASEQPLNR